MATTSSTTVTQDDQRQLQLGSTIMALAEWASLATA